MGRRDEGVKIPMLVKEHYFHWKVKMRLHLLSLDPSYINCIEKGPHVPVKINTALILDGSEAEDVEVPRNPSELLKKMRKSVINCPAAKEVWDTIQTLCEGTDQVKENKMQLFVQQYESFHFKSGESLNDLFNRFQKLLDGLKLYGRVYMVKESNLKFLRALPRDWKPMTVVIRQAQNFNEYPLDKLYGILKTYELEIQQDEELEKNSKKEKTVALVAEKEEEGEKTLKSVVKNSSNNTGEGKNEAGKNKGKIIEENKESSAQDELDDLDEHLAFLARKFSKLKFKRNAANSRPFNRGNQSKPSDYRRKYFDLLKQNKEKAFITEDGDWAADEGDSDNEERVNLTLMAIGDEADSSTTSSGQVKTSNTSDLTKSECKQIIDDMSNEIYNLRVSLKSLTKENVRIQGTNDLLVERNGKLETELIQLDKFKKSSELAKDDLLAVLKREEILKKQLEREQEIIAKWKYSRNVLKNMCSTQVLEDSCMNSRKKNKKLLDDSNLLVDSDNPLTNTPSTDESHPSKNQTAVDEEKLKKLDKKYGPIDKNFVKESGSFKKTERRQFMPNPYFGAFNMPAMPIHYDNMNHAFINQISGNSTNVSSSNSVVIPKVKKLNFEDEVVSKPSKSKESNASKPKGGRKNLWYLDSGCSRHMIGDSTLLSKFEERAGPSITFGDDNKGFTLRYGFTSKGNVIYDNVALVKGVKHNLLSISQLCDRGHQVWKGNVYIADFNSTSADYLTCLFSKASLDDSWLWHKKLSHLNFKTMNDLVRKDLVRGLPKLEFSKDVNIMFISKNKYCLVIVDDFKRFTWTYFLHAKDEASEIIINHIKIVDNIDPIKKLSRIRSDNGTEFMNSTMKDFCEEKGIHHEFFAARTPQQNGVVERKNITLIEALLG
ncbi:uncharacterized protein LOC135150404 [Daucus carota subsp. sativus]|uniref:uncharacterized protein LOC135150404 n=1 Tax=Daucus carota subsp. sativus TaxID=79200 RepID=UPI003083737B